MQSEGYSSSQAKTDIARDFTLSSKDQGNLSDKNMMQIDASFAPTGGDRLGGGSQVQSSIEVSQFHNPFHHVPVKIREVSRASPPLVVNEKQITKSVMQ